MPSWLMLWVYLGLPSIVVAQSQANPSFNLVNRSSEAIVHLYANPAGFTNWGQDRLSGSKVAPGARFAVRLLANGNCIYDVRVVFADGRAEDRRNINTCNAEDLVIGAQAGGAPAAATGQTAKNDPSFRLVNRGRDAVRELYAMPAGHTNWGPNRLGAEPLAAGTYRTIRLPRDGDCVLDIRAVFADGAVTERRQINTCETIDLPIP